MRRRANMHILMAGTDQKTRTRSDLDLILFKIFKTGISALGHQRGAATPWLFACRKTSNASSCTWIAISSPASQQTQLASSRVLSGELYRP